MPTFEPTETGSSVHFDDDAASSKARMRFEEPIAKHPALRLEPQEREDRAEQGQEDPWADVVARDGDIEDEQDDEDDRERSSGADPG